MLIAALIALILILFPEIFMRKNRQINPVEVRQLDSLAALLEKPVHSDLTVSLFLFNPNTISLDSWLLLGFPRKVAERYLNYRVKGGRFYVKEDVKKIYGLSDDVMNTLYAYINLPDSISAVDSKQIIQKMDLNQVSIDQIQSINKVGEAIARRIVLYRNLLGGFVLVNQLSEVYNIPEETLKNLKSVVFINPGFVPKKVKINQDKLEVLEHHPYISDQLAEDIVRFREINGSIKSEKLLADFKSIDKGNFEKLIFYLDFQ